MTFLPALRGALMLSAVSMTGILLAGPALPQQAPVALEAGQAASAWEFLPDYHLPRRAAAHPLDAVVPAPGIAVEASSPQFFGLTATQRTTLTLKTALAAGAPFSVELWVLDHVNQPVGALLSPRGMTAGAPSWALGYRDGVLVFGPLDASGTPLLSAPAPEEGYKERWYAVTGVYDGATWTLYSNGVQVAAAAGPAATGTATLDLTGYLANEPYMEIANLVRGAALHDRALSADEVKAAFEARTRLVDDGRLTDAALHFTQPPYLNVPSETAIELSWETDRPAASVVEWGTTKGALQSQSFAAGERLGGMTISGLTADTPYFYRVTATDAAGLKIDSGLLSFRTAPQPGQPFTIAVSGDTEARPHINNRMSQLIWDERPNLLMLAGDLTDGGSAEKRFEWTHEYFVGMGALFGRVPVIAALGNGEDELKWYRHYHRHPGTENYFSHRYGDVEIFVLDSYLETRETAEPGFRARQKAWLDGALRASTAKWKFAIHHHDMQTSDEDDYGDSWSETSTHGDAQVQADFRGLFETYNVDLVFFGHLHTYERSWPLRGGKVDLQTGITYLQVGGMGGNLEDFAPNKPAFSRKTMRGHHYVMIRGAGDMLSVETFDIEGRLRDRFDLVKTGAGPARIVGAP
jgi:hypothetical protein